MSRKLEERSGDVKVANFKSVLSNKSLKFELALTSAFFLGINKGKNVASAFFMLFFLNLFYLFFCQCIDISLCMDLLFETKRSFKLTIVLLMQVIVKVWNRKNNCRYIWTEREFMQTMDDIHAFKVS